MTKHSDGLGSSEATTHELKCWPGPFAAMLDGSKTAEFRKDDRGFRVGDTLRLREWTPQRADYTGRELTRRVTHILGPEFGVPDGFVMLSLAALSERKADTPEPARDLLDRAAYMKPADDTILAWISEAQSSVWGAVAQTHRVLDAYRAWLRAESGAERPSEAMAADEIATLWDLHFAGSEWPPLMHKRFAFARALLRTPSKDGSTPTPETKP